MRILKILSGAFIVMCLISSIALAQVPRPNVVDGGNRWRITFYNDPDNTHQQWATQIICFLPYSPVGTSIQGTWYALTFPDWNGQYYQEGDEVKMTGDYDQDIGHDHMTLFHTTFDRSRNGRGMAFKDWTEWREDGQFGRIIGWGNTRMTRDGFCPAPQSARNQLQDVVHKVERLTHNERTALEQEEALRFSQSLPPRLKRNGEEGQFPGEKDLESVEDYLERIRLD